MAIFTWISLVIFIFCVGTVAKKIANHSLSEWLIASFILFVGSVVPVGFILSPLKLTDSVIGWIVGVFVAIGVQYVVWSRLVPDHGTYSIRALTQNRVVAFKNWFEELSIYLKFLFSLMLGTVIVLGVTNLLLLIVTPPNEWDSMTGHLNRVIRYIQHGTMAHFGGANWNMDTYPRSVTTIQIYLYLISGETENAMKLIHFGAYWITLVAIFGTAQRIGRNISASIFCALAYSMFLDFLLQSIYTETDIVLTAYLSILIYFVFSFYNTKKNYYLYLAGMVFSIALGHKITFILLMPSVFVIMIYAVFAAPTFQIFIDRTWRLGAAIVFTSLIYTWPTGYIANMQAFGHPIGPPTALRHQSIERAGPLSNLFEQGSRNVIRYSYDFFNLDGIRNAQWGYDLNNVIRKPIIFLEDKLKMRLDEEEDFTIVPFRFNTRFDYFNANPYWGVFGFALVLPMVLLFFFRIFRSRVYWFLSLAVILHLMALAYSAPYDPFKGRYFIENGSIAVLFLLLLFSHHRITILKPKRTIWRAYVGMIVLLACLSAFMSVFLNMRALPFAAYGMPSAFKMERIAYQTFARPDMTKAYQTYDSIVPQDAVVALGTINDDFEYPLYGAKLTRKLISINPFEQALRPIPKEADYLFYARSVINDTSKIKALPTDIRLGSDTTMKGLIVKGEDYYLRKLK